MKSPVSWLPRLTLWALPLGILGLLLLIVSRPELIETTEVISQQQAVGTLIVSAMLLILVQFHRTNQRLREVLKVANAIGRGNYGTRSKVGGHLRYFYPRAQPAKSAQSNN